MTIDTAFAGFLVLGALVNAYIIYEAMSGKKWAVVGGTNYSTEGFYRAMHSAAVDMLERKDGGV